MLSDKTIRLRAIEEKDLEWIAIARSDPQMCQYFCEYAPISLRQQTKWYEAQLNNKNEFNWVITSAAGEAIGTISIYDIDGRNRKAEWGRFCIFNQSYRGQGVGRAALGLVIQYAFEHLNLHKLYCDVLSDNSAAIALYKSMGFSEEGLLRDHIFKFGRYKDLLRLFLLESSYFAQKVDSSMNEAVMMQEKQ